MTHLIYSLYFILSILSLNLVPEGILSKSAPRMTHSRLHDLATNETPFTSIFQSSFTLDPSTNIFPVGAAFSAQVFQVVLCYASLLIVVFAV